VLDKDDAINAKGGDDLVTLEELDCLSKDLFYILFIKCTIKIISNHHLQSVAFPDAELVGTLDSDLVVGFLRRSLLCLRRSLFGVLVVLDFAIIGFFLVAEVSC